MPRKCSILLSDRSWVSLATSEEVEIEQAPDDVVFEGFDAGSLVEFDIHAVGIEEEDAMGASSAVIEVNRVVPVEVGVCGDAEGITTPEGPDLSLPAVVEVKTEGFRVFAQTVDIGVLGEGGLEPQILLFVDELVTRS